MIPGSRTQPVVTNQSMVLFNSAAGVDGIVYSNTVNTPVVGPVLSLLKSTDKLHASLGDTLVYTFKASNNGNTDAFLTVFDILPEGVSFISNSVLRDGVPLPGLHRLQASPWFYCTAESSEHRLSSRHHFPAVFPSAAK